MRIAGLILLGLLLVSTSTSVAFSDDVTVSPGKFDLKLGVGFPTFGPVKLSYPNSSILTNSVGDLLFAVNLTKPGNYSGVSIYIPPDFSGLTLGKVWTSFTNNYDPHSLSLSKLSSSDRIGPNWWEITVNHLTLTAIPSQANPTNKTFLINEPQYIRLFQVTSPPTAGRYFFKALVNGTSIGAENFPTVVVKASRDPAYISGVLRDLGDRNLSRAGRPIYLPNGTGARVLATGVDYLGRPASAQTFINSTANGNYTLFGVAPGTYNITAYAAGYIPTTRPIRVSVSPAQSLQGVDIYLPESANVTGRVLSESYLGTQIPWGFLSTETLSGIHGTTPRAITVKLLNLDGSVAASTAAPYGAPGPTDPSSKFFDFSIQRQVGFDGRIPQDYANYTSGLKSGDYLLFAYVSSYVQLEEVRVHVANETTETFSTIPLIRSGTFTVTVHFQDLNSSREEDHILINSTLTVRAYNQKGVLSAQNITFVQAGNKSASVELQGFSSSRSFGTTSLFPPNSGLLPGTYQIIARVASSATIYGSANTGIRDFYYQTDNVQATIGLGSNVSLSFPVYRAGGINLTVYSIDDETPPLNRPWSYPGKTINILIIGSKGAVYQANATQRSKSMYSNNVTFTYVGLQTDSYLVVVQTLGYTQKEILRLNVVLGGTSDASVWMIKDPVIDLTVFFRDEGLLSNITSHKPFAPPLPINNTGGTPARVEVFDDHGNFIAANASYIPNSVGYANFTLAGFDRYSGNPRLVWSGFYDTTDGTTQIPGGLFLYPWDGLLREFTIRIWVEGYYQLTNLRLVVPASGNVSVVAPVDRATRIIGNVAGPDFFDTARPLSWATVALEPNNYTLTRIIDVRPGNYSTSSLDGSFQLWVPEGSYGMGVSLAGYSTYSTRISAPSGSELSLQIWLENYQPSPLAGAVLFSSRNPMARIAADAPPPDNILDAGWDFNQTT